MSWNSRNLRIRGPHNILLECDERPAYLTVFSPLPVGNTTQRGDIIVFQDKGRATLLTLGSVTKWGGTTTQSCRPLSIGRKG